MHVKMLTLTILCMYSHTCTFTFTHVHTLIHTHVSSVHIHIHMYNKYLRDLDLLRICHSIRPFSSCQPVFLHSFQLIVTFNKPEQAAATCAQLEQTLVLMQCSASRSQWPRKKAQGYTDPLASNPSSSNPFTTLLLYKPVLFVGHVRAAWDVQAEEMTSDCHDLSLW